MARPALNWQLRRLPVCASTEVELERWLSQRDQAQRAQHLGAGAPALGVQLAVVARRQRFGQGQRGRVWQSPEGGLWISAAFPWPTVQLGGQLPAKPTAQLGAELEAPPALAPLGLAAAVGVARQLQGLGISVALKWPNDLLVGGHKLAGLLPRLRWRGGRVRWAQVGLGLNGINRPPAGAISVAQALAGTPFHPQAKPQRLLPLALDALEWAQQMAQDPEAVHQAAEDLLLRPPEGLVHAGEHWQVAGLEPDGGLRLVRPGAAITLQRRC